MDWQAYIHRDPGILVGKPVVRGTRLGIAFILDLFAGDGQNRWCWKRIQT